ncbi:MAG: tripartite tricarboxylate transporter substrate binding protein [Spirochaetales bacterium]|jgi:tripartite-type tricarboxylate transporter receptor subunit TctC|nr:tripartite tricarboxylate transporter substrate binding protein [Spirochaetales bacterium]
MMKKVVKLFPLVCLVIMLTAGGGAAIAAGSSDQAASGAKWPARDITVIVNMGAGGDTDYNGRLLCRYLEKELGVSIPVSNVPGSNGAIANAQYKDGNPDGYTFLVTNTVALSGNEATGLSDFGYDSFSPVAIFGKQSGENLIVPANSPYKTMQDFIDASKAKPDTIKYAISTGGGAYISYVIMSQAGGAKLVPIDAGDGAARMASLLGGHVDAAIVPYATAKEYIEAGRVKTLATFMGESPTLLKDVPPAKDVIPEAVLPTMYIMLAPKGTDPAAVEGMNKAILNIIKNNAEYKAECEKFNFQSPFALDVQGTLKELEAQRKHFMIFSKFLGKK